MSKANPFYTPDQLAAMRKLAVLTPEQRAAFQKLVVTPEQRAAFQKLVLTPDQRAAFQKLAATNSREERAKLDKMGERIDRALAIRDGLIPPPWAEKLLKPASERKAKPEPEPDATEPKAKPEKKRKHHWDDDVDRVLREHFPNNSATNHKPKDVVKKVLEILDRKIKTSGRKPPSRGLILRKIGRWKSR